MPLEPHPTDPDKLVFRSSGRLTPLCMCREPWALERVHRQKTPCFDYVERKPLTDEEIFRLMVGEDRVQLLYSKRGDPYFSEFAEGAIRELVESGRAIERAHGIGAQNGS